MYGAENDVEPTETTETEPTSELRVYPFRQRKVSSRYPASEYVLLTDEGEPECYEETMQDVHKREWYNVMQDEIKFLHEDHTYDLIELPKAKSANGSSN